MKIKNSVEQRRSKNLFIHVGLLVFGTLLLLSCTQTIELKAERYAFVIGISDYINNNYVNDLHVASKDAIDISKVLGDSGWEIFQNNLIDKDATKKAIEDSIQSFFKDKSKDSTALIYYSGHGTEDETEAFLVPSDYDGTLDSLISASEFSAWIEKYISPYTKNIIIIADSCNSGGFIRKTDSIDIIDQEYSLYNSNTVATSAISGLSNFGELLRLNSRILESSSPIIISAAGADEESYEDYPRYPDEPSLNQGVFTYYLLESADPFGDINGDSNGDGYITCTEAYNYVARAIDRNWNKAQSSRFYPHMSGGLRDLVLFDLN